MNNSHEIEIRELLQGLWRQKLLFIGIVFFFALASVVFAITKQNIFKAEILLSPAEANSQSAGLASQLGGLAALSGINLQNNDVKVNLALEILTSRQFTARFIAKYQLLVPLMAAKEWDERSGNIVLDPDIYDVENKTWVRKVPAGRSTIPTEQEAYEVFSKILQYETVKGFVHVSLEYISPVLAQEWLTLLIQELNDTLKQEDVKDASNNINYLEKQIATTQLADMKQVFYQLIEEQTKKLMLAEAQPEYVFKVVDPAVIPEKKDSPKRALICIVGTFLGCVLGFFVCLVRVILRAGRNNAAL